MHVNVVGVGAIGTLLSFYLKRTARQLVQDPQSYRLLPHSSSIPYLPPPLNLGVILRLRNRNVSLGMVKKSTTSIIVERNSVKQRENEFGVIMESAVDGFSRVSAPAPNKDELPGRSALEDLGYPKGSIDSLIVTTKAQNTLSALRPLLPHITPATTIVLLQNGQGVLDLLLQRLFPDPKKRPHFILASTTHGAYQRGKLHCVHAAAGKLDFGIVPSEILGSRFERVLEAPTEQVISGDNQKYDERLSEVPTGYDRFLPRAERGTSRGSGFMLRPPSTLDIGAIPQIPATQTLIHTVAMLLNLPLGVTWHPIRKFQMIALRKLVINACINPVTALVECRNGDLFGNRYAEHTMKEICREISMILEALAQNTYVREEERRRRQAEGVRTAGLTSPGDEEGYEDEVQVDFESMSRSDFLLSSSNIPNSEGQPVLDASLQPVRLYQEVERVIRLTAPNYSSMLQDIQSQAPSTEITFINGYFSRLGKSLGLATPINDLMVNMIRLKTSRTSTPWKAKQ